MALCVEAGAPVILTTGAATAAGEAGGAGFATEFQVEATQPELSGTSGTVQVTVGTTVGTTDGTAQDNVLFVDSVVSHLGKRVGGGSRKKVKENGG